MKRKFFIDNADLEAIYSSMSSIELRNAYDAAIALTKQIDEVLKIRARAEEPTARCEYTVTPVTEDGIDGIRIYGKIINRDERDAHMALYRSVSGNWEDRRSVLYYRVNGLIFHQHGGWLILANQDINDPFRKYDMPIPCTDEQWKQLLEGTIPAELMNKNIE